VDPATAHALADGYLAYSTSGDTVLLSGIPREDGVAV